MFYLSVGLNLKSGFFSVSSHHSSSSNMAHFPVKRYFLHAPSLPPSLHCPCPAQHVPSIRQRRVCTLGTSGDTLPPPAAACATHALFAHDPPSSTVAAPRRLPYLQILLGNIAGHKLTAFECCEEETLYDRRARRVVAAHRT